MKDGCKYKLLIYQDTKECLKIINSVEKEFYFGMMVLHIKDNSVEV